MKYQISGLADYRLWFVFASNRETAEHIARSLKESGHTEVTITVIGDHEDEDRVKRFF